MATNRELFVLMTSPVEELAYVKGYTLTGLSLKMKEKSVLMVIKVRKRLDGDMVAFIEAPDVLGCWDYLADHLHRTNAPLRFRPDKWARK